MESNVPFRQESGEARMTPFHWFVSVLRDCFGDLTPWDG